MKLKDIKFAVAILVISTTLSACASEEVAVQTPTEVPYPVTTTTAESQVTTVLEVTGTAESKRSTQVFAPTAGVVTQLFVRDGSRVKAGTPLFKIGGVNGTPHPLEAQMRTAYAQAVAAVNGYNTTVRSNNLALSGAYLGYYSSVNQTQASQLDMQVINENKYALDKSLAVLRVSLDKTTDENQRGQIIAQISQAETQRRVLDLTQQSAVYKLGLTETGSFPELQGWMQIPTAQLRNEGSLIQAKTQVTLAKEQYELARNQWESLVVRAQSNGVVNGLDLSVGSPVGPQLPAATIIDSSVITADVGVNETDAYLINSKTPVEIQFGQGYEKSRIISISPQVDIQSRKVMITIAVPPNTIRVNGTVNAKFNIDALLVSKEARVFVPLDAVIVSTEETFVFVIEDGKAKKRTVKRGEIAHDKVEILEGIAAGEIIILAGAKNVYDGQLVSTGITESMQAI